MIFDMFERNIIMGKFNVGDKVRIVSERGMCWNMEGLMDKWCNKVMTIREDNDGLYHMVEDKAENGGNGWCWSDEDFVEVVTTKKAEKIVITHDGKTTTATLYKADGSKERATARCAPEDTFDFNFGANLAMERLMEKVTEPEPPKYYNGKVVCVANEYGDSIPINCYTIGKIYEVVDGVITGDDGWKCIPEPTLEKLCIGVGNKFIPLVE